MPALVPFNRKNAMLRTNGFDDFYNMIDDFFSNSPSTKRNLINDTFKIDVKENEQAFSIEAELPGIKREDISIELHDGVLSIAVQHDEKKEEKTDLYIHRERRFGSMQRSIRLGEINESEVSAKFEDGVLNIKVPKAQNQEIRRKIEIE